tara:strand:+ start:182 stop:505 length:324 start_codon:yes stop_codon:yes gene_type:complete
MGLANSGTAGYTAGGYPMTAVIDKLTYASDGNAAISPTLSAQRWGGNTGSLSGTAGYWGGGSTSGANSTYVTTIDKTAFSDDSTAALSATLSTQRVVNSGFGDDSGL